MTATDPVLRRAPDALVRLCPDRTLVLVGDSVHTLAGAGVALWDLLVDPLRAPDVVQRMQAIFAEMAVSSDVATFVDDLVRVGVLVSDSPPVN